MINFNKSYSSLSTRIWSTTLFQAIVFTLTIGLAIIDSSEWPEIFFWITMLSAVVINIANGIFQGCVYGIAAKLPMKYTNSVTFGFSISGSISSLFMIISITIAPNPKEVAIYFFSFAVFYLLLCFVNELLLKRNVSLRKILLISFQSQNYIIYRNSLCFIWKMRRE